MLIMPIAVLFLQEHGLSMKEVLLLQSVFSITVVLFEVPSGYLSDIINRKLSIIIGSTLTFIGLAVFSISYKFIGFLVAELILGFGSSLISGTDSALIYDTLLQMKEEKYYKKKEATLLAIANFSEGIASILGAFLAVVSLRMPFYFETAVAFLSIPVAFTLIEPTQHKYDNREGNLKSISKIVKYSLHDNVQIKWLIIYSSIVNASTLTMVWFIQPYWKLVGVPLALFGVLWSTLQLSAGVFSLYSPKFELVFGRRKTLISLILLPVIGYLLLGFYQTIWSSMFIIIFYFVRAINGPILRDYINGMITSDMRATVLSVKNLVERLHFAIIGPVIGWANDLYSLKIALFISGIIFLFLGIVPVLFLHKYKIL